MESIYRFAVPFINRIVSKCFDESTFVSSEKLSLIHPSVKGQGLDQDNMGYYCPVSNLTFLSKVIEQVMPDQLWKFLEENKIIPVHQFAHRKMYSTKTVLCIILYTVILSSVPVKAKHLS